jgi:hypothetical protein
VYAPVEMWSHKYFALLRSCGIIYKHIPDCDDFHLSYCQCFHVLPLTSTHNTMHKIQSVKYLHTLLKLFITKYVYILKYTNTKARYCFIWQYLIGNNILAFTSILTLTAWPSHVIHYDVMNNNIKNQTNCSS